MISLPGRWTLDVVKWGCNTFILGLFILGNLLKLKLMGPNGQGPLLTCLLENHVAGAPEVYLFLPLLIFIWFTPSPSSWRWFGSHLLPLAQFKFTEGPWVRMLEDPILTGKPLLGLHEPITSKSLHAKFSLHSVLFVPFSYLIWNWYVWISQKSILRSEEHCVTLWVEDL